MVQAWKVFAVAGLFASGCLWERDLDNRLARLQLGVNTRRVAATPAPPSPGVARTASPTEPASEPTMSGATGSLQFTMRLVPGIYAGGEIEAGPFGQTGYLSGAYGVAGAEATSSIGSLSVELTGGRRWLRHDVGADDIPATVLEPRVRAQLALGSQVTLGGVIGASALSDQHGWMAGLYLGIYSADLGAGR